MEILVTSWQPAHKSSEQAAFRKVGFPSSQTLFTKPQPVPLPCIIKFHISLVFNSHLKNTTLHKNPHQAVSCVTPGGQGVSEHWGSWIAVIFFNV